MDNEKLFNIVKALKSGFRVEELISEYQYDRDEVLFALKLIYFFNSSKLTNMSL